MKHVAAYLALGILAVSLSACTGSTGSANLVPQNQAHQALDIGGNGGGPQSQNRSAQDINGGGPQ
jgi:hypothetical protein